jgi:hypothetical protein
MGFANPNPMISAVSAISSSKPFMMVKDTLPGSPTDRYFRTYDGWKKMNVGWDDERKNTTPITLSEIEDKEVTESLNGLSQQIRQVEIDTAKNIFNVTHDYDWDMIPAWSRKTYIQKSHLDFYLRNHDLSTQEKQKKITKAYNNWLKKKR